MFLESLNGHSILLHQHLFSLLHEVAVVLLVEIKVVPPSFSRLLPMQSRLEVFLISNLLSYESDV